MPNSFNKIFKQASVVASAIGAGVVTGLMLAPKSGKETRKDIKEKIDDAKDTIETKGTDIKKDVTEKADEIKKDLQSKVDSIRK
jgi:gas vesicle protein